MCTLAAYVGLSPGLPLVVAANRDEFLDRPSTDPAVIAVDPWVFAGQDLRGGGTWLGVNAHGVVVGMLNRRRPQGPDPHRRSRGLLCLELLQARSLAAAIAILDAVCAERYNPFNVLVADRHQAWVASPAGDTVRRVPLAVGAHLLTNLALNDPTCPRIAKASRHFAALSVPPGADAAPMVAPLRALLADHDTALDPRAEVIDTLCVHRPGYGTRSASILAMDARGRVRWWHSAGPPCRTAFAELPLPEPAIVSGQRALD